MASDWVVVIDTDKPAGNFSDEMCAFVAGCYGDYGRGRTLAEQEQARIRNYGWFKAHIVRRLDESGHSWPCSSWPTPGWFGNGRGKKYKDTPEAEQQALLDQAAHAIKFYGSLIASVQRKLDAEDYGDRTKEAWEREIERYLDEIERSKLKLVKFPAHLSVAIFFNARPPAPVMEEITERAVAYAQGAMKIEKVRVFKAPRR